MKRIIKQTRQLFRFSVTILVSLVLFTQFAQAAKPVSLVVNGSTLTLDVSPEVRDGRTLVPVRGVFEALDASVSWDGKNKTIVVSTPGKAIVLKLGQQWAIVNGEKRSLDVPPVIVSSRTLIPLRFVGEALGANVAWDSGTRSVAVTTPPPVNQQQPITTEQGGDTVASEPSGQEPVTPSQEAGNGNVSEEVPSPQPSDESTLPGTGSGEPASNPPAGDTELPPSGQLGGEIGNPGGDLPVPGGGNEIPENPGEGSSEQVPDDQPVGEPTPEPVFTDQPVSDLPGNDEPVNQPGGDADFPSPDDSNSTQPSGSQPGDASGSSGETTPDPDGLAISEAPSQETPGQQAGTSSPAEQPQAAGTVVRLQVTSGTPAVGETFTTILAVEDVKDLYAYQIGLTFDPALVEVFTLKEGGVLKGSIDFTAILGQPKYDNSGGSINIIRTLLNPSPPVNGTGILLEITWQAKKEGTLTIPLTVDTVQMVSFTEGKFIPFQGVGGSITIN